MRFFHSSTSNEDIEIRINSIKNKIANQCGLTAFVEKEGWIAFSGSFDKPELLLTISGMKTGGKDYLYADVDDEISWQEWDFENREDFENAVAEYIASLVNRTIKTVTEKKKHKYIKTSRYYLDDDNEWVLIDEDIMNHWLIRLFIKKDSVSEELKAYKIQ